MVTPCSSPELVRRSLAGLGVPRPATGPLAVHYCAALAGVSLREYTLDARALADSVIRYYMRFRPDAVWLSADTWVTAEAMGAPVEFPAGDQPLGGTGRPLVRAAADIERLPGPDLSRGRWPLMLEALGRIRDALRDRAFIVACFDQYPFSLACALMGMEQVMLAMSDDRPLVTALMERCQAFTIAYARALAAAGADLLSGGDSPAGLLGPGLYREVARPFECAVIGALKPIGLPVSLHICGNATAILADMASTGADVLELDHRVDLAAACRAVGPEIAIWGNLDPVGCLARATPVEVARQIRRAIDTFREMNHTRFVISSGCTLPIDTPSENLDAFFAETRA